MLTEAQRSVVWESWLAAEVRAAYFGDLAQHFHRQHRLFTWTSLIASSGAFASMVTNLALSWLPPALAAAAAMVSLYALVSQFVRSAIESRDMHARWNRLAIDYQALWNEWYLEGAADKLARLNDRRAEASASGTALPYREKRMVKWFDKVMANRARHITAAA